MGGDGNSAKATELVLLSGVSGTGKSHLAKSSLRDLVRRSGGIFLRGKFEMRTQLIGEPYQAFSDAFESLCGVIARSVDDLSISLEDIGHGCSSVAKFLRARSAVKEAIGKDESAIAALSQIVPRLNELLGRHINADQSRNLQSAVNSNGSKNRLFYLTRTFLRAVCTEIPLVLFLDDLQWADSASLEMLKTLLLDGKNPGLLLVASYRSNEVEDGRARILSEWLRNLRNQKEELPTGITHIQLGNLSLDALNEFLADLLTSSTATTRELADVVHRRTHGNIFFVIQFLKKLCSNKVLHFCLGNMRWVWDNVEKIEAETCVTDNVLDLTIDNLTTVDESARAILQIAACLGSTFDFGTLSLVVGRLGDGTGDSLLTPIAGKLPRDMDAIIFCMNSCVDQGLLEKESRSSVSERECKYRFVHDQIIAATFSLIPVQSCNELQYRIGETLVNNLTDENFERDIFDIVGLLNEGVSSLSPGGHRALELARLNIRAGKKAMACSAFEPASKYLKVGLSLLGPDSWHSQPKLCLELFNALIDSEDCNGSYETMEMYVDEVLAQDIPLDDKIHVYCSRIRSRLFKNQASEAADVALDVLTQLGVTIPQTTSKLAILKSFLRTKFLLRGQSVADFQDLAPMNDKRRLKCMQLMDRYIEVIFFVKPALFVMVILKMVRWSVRYGVCKFSSTAFCLYGLLLVSIEGDIHRGNQFAKLGLAFAKRFDAKETESRISFYGCQFCAHWIEPVHLVCKKMLRQYKANFEEGEIQWAMMSARTYCAMAMCAGTALPILNTEIGNFVQHIKELGHQKTLIYLFIQWQFVRNLMGLAKDPQVLNGDIAQEEDILQQCEQGKDLPALAVMRCYQMFAAFYFENYTRSAQVLGELKPLIHAMRSVPLMWRSCFYEGLTAFSLARIKKSRKWKMYALKVMSRVQRWTEQGSVNCKLISMFFEAEREVLDGKTEVAVHKYSLAISATVRCGFMHDRAFGNQRVGELHVEMGDHPSAAHHLSLAVSLYESWGATAIAAHLRKKHLLLFAKETPTLVVEQE